MMKSRQRKKTKGAVALALGLLLALGCAKPSDETRAGRSPDDGAPAAPEAAAGQPPVVSPSGRAVEDRPTVEEAASKGVDNLFAELRDRLDKDKRLELEASTEMIAGAEPAQLKTLFVQNVAPALSALEGHLAWLRTQANEAIAPLQNAVDRQEDAARKETDAAVSLYIKEPRGEKGVYQGIDEFSKQWVVVVTTKQRPARIGRTARLSSIHGDFARAGSLVGKNAFGVEVSNPKYVDPPTTEQERARALRSQLNNLKGRIATEPDEIVTKYASPIVTTYVASLDRAKNLIEAKVEERKASAMARLQSPTVDERASAHRAVLATHETVKDDTASVLSAHLSDALADWHRHADSVRTTLENELGAVVQSSLELLKDLGVAHSPLAQGHDVQATFKRLSSGNRLAGVLRAFNQSRDAYDEALRRRHGADVENCERDLNSCEMVSVVERYTYCGGVDQGRDGVLYVTPDPEKGDMSLVRHNGESESHRNTMSMGREFEAAWKYEARRVERPFVCRIARHGEFVILRDRIERKMSVFNASLTRKMFIASDKSLAFACSAGLAVFAPRIRRGKGQWDFRMIDMDGVESISERDVSSYLRTQTHLLLRCGSFDEVLSFDLHTGQKVAAFYEAVGALASELGMNRQVSLTEGKAWFYSYSLQSLVGISADGKTEKRLFTGKRRGRGQKCEPSVVGNQRLLRPEQSRAIVLGDTAFVFGKKAATEREAKGVPWTLVALSTADGSERWTMKIDAAYIPKEVLRNDNLAAVACEGPHGNRMYLVDWRSGKELKTLGFSRGSQTRISGFKAVFAVSGAIAVVSCDNPGVGSRYVALNCKSGEIIEEEEFYWNDAKGKKAFIGKHVASETRAVGSVQRPDLSWNVVELPVDVNGSRRLIQATVSGSGGTARWLVLDAGGAYERNLAATKEHGRIAEFRGYCFLGSDRIERVRLTK